MLCWASIHMYPYIFTFLLETCAICHEKKLSCHRDTARRSLSCEISIKGSSAQPQFCFCYHAMVRSTKVARY